MNSDPGIPINTATPVKPWLRRILSLPSTRLGWWSVSLMGIFASLIFLNFTVLKGLSEAVPWRQTLLPFYGIGMIACGLAAGIVAFTAVVRHQERSWLVWLPILAGLFILFLILGEFLVPH